MGKEKLLEELVLLWRKGVEVDKIKRYDGCMGRALGKDESYQSSRKVQRRMSASTSGEVDSEEGGPECIKRPDI